MTGSGPVSTTGPVDRTEYRNVMGHFASGVVILSGLHDGLPAGMTCQSFFSLSLDPPLIAVAPGVSSTSWPRVSSTGRFAVNVLSSEQEVLARGFARSGVDKFAGVDWDLSAHGSPHLAGALAWIDCEVWQIGTAGDHFLVTARVAQIRRSSGHPLLYFRGEFSSWPDGEARD